MRTTQLALAAATLLAALAAADSAAGIYAYLPAGFVSSRGAPPPALLGQALAALADTAAATFVYPSASSAATSSYVLVLDGLSMDSVTTSSMPKLAAKVASRSVVQADCNYTQSAALARLLVQLPAGAPSAYNATLGHACVAEADWTTVNKESPRVASAVAALCARAVAPAANSVSVIPRDDVLDAEAGGQAARGRAVAYNATLGYACVAEADWTTVNKESPRVASAVAALCARAVAPAANSVSVIPLRGISSLSSKTAALSILDTAAAALIEAVEKDGKAVVSVVLSTVESLAASHEGSEPTALINVAVVNPNADIPITGGMYHITIWVPLMLLFVTSASVLAFWIAL
eukprot:m51a1_g14114 hypothetical protein (349) ;mRNA; r:135957-137691